MNLLKISHFPDFIQYFPDCSQRFPDFSLTKFFKVRKCERCGSLNPRLSILAIQFVVFINIEIFLLSSVSIFRNCIPWNSIKIFTDPPPWSFLLFLFFHWNSIKILTITWNFPVFIPSTSWNLQNSNPFEFFCTDFSGPFPQ